MSELRFDDQVAIVTGAGRGIGRCHALLLAERGAKVVVADLGGGLDGSGKSTGPADEVVQEIEAAGGQAVACAASVADEAGAESIVQAALDTYGRLDIVVNNAGIADPDWFEDISMDRFRLMVQVHFFGTVFVCNAAWPHLMSAGYGRIVNTCSEAAFGLVPKATSYGASKGGILSFTRELALEAPRHGIRVNAVGPRAQTRLSGPDILARTYDLPEDMFTGGALDQYDPALVSPAMAYLAHESCELNGETLIAGGGQVMRAAILVSQGLTADDLTPELVAENLPQIMDMTKANDMIVQVIASDEIHAAMEATDGA